MHEIYFGDCRTDLEIPVGFSDDNVIVTDGDLAQLPNLRFLRHGNINEAVSNCRFEIPASTRGGIHIYVACSESAIKIGQNTRLNLNLRLWRAPYIEIQDNTTINSAKFVADKSEIIVGPDCMFSDDILVQSSDQHGLWDLEANELLNGAHRRVVIGEHVWIGRGAKIMPDVTIGSGSVVGTGAVVTKPVSGCSFAVGVPAKAVRSKSSWTRSPISPTPRERDFFARMREQNFLEDVQ